MTCEITANRQINSSSRYRFPLARYVKNWWIRRKVLALLDMEDKILVDIGVDRAEIYWATRLPLSTNAAVALNDLASKRRKTGRAGNRIYDR